MDLLGLYAKISLDDGEFQDGMERAAKTSKTVKAAVDALQSPFDRLEKGINAVAHPIETAKNAFEGLKAKTEAIRHPIEALKNKWDEASSSVQRQRDMLQSLASRYEEARAKVSQLTREYDQSVKETGKTSEKSQELADKLVSAQGSALYAKEAMERYAAAVAETGKESQESEGKTAAFAETLGSGIVKAAKLAATALAAAEAAVGTLAKSAVASYGDYEQLVGGVETLFKDSAGQVQQYADNAYQTAGLSANEYMETVTGFSASLLQSLDGDTARAADLADLAIRDMSDNANKMGSDMESIQNAYQGFAKQNYTMLDNLKLGYGGTKEEMQRLLKDAEKLSGQKFNLSSYADIVEAIHVVQTEMGISGITAEEAAAAVASGAMTQEEAFAAMGTTAKEAATTIQGSLGAMKSAWSNLVTALVAGDNLDDVINSFVQSASTAAQNILPALEQALGGIGQLAAQLGPIIAEQAPAIIDQALPALLDAGMLLLDGLMEGILAALPALTEGAVQIVLALSKFLLDNLPELVNAALQIVIAFGNGIADALPELIPVAVDAILQIVDALIDNVDQLIDSAIAIVLALADGLIEALPKLIEKAPEIVQKLVSAIVENAPKLLGAAWELVSKLFTGIVDNLPEIGKAAAEIIGTLKDGVLNLGEKIWNVGRDIVAGVWNGIDEKLDWLKEKVKGFFGNVLGGVKDFLGIRSPSKLFREEVGQYIGLGVAAGIGDTEDKAVKAADKLAKEVYNRSKAWAERQTKLQELSLQEQIELWLEIQRQFKAGSEQFLQAEEKVFDLRQKLAKEQEAAEEQRKQKYEKILKERESALKEYQGKVEQIQKEMASAEEEYQKTLESRTQQIFNSFGLFDELPKKQKVAGDQLILNLRGQVNQMEQFYAGLETLAQRGVGADLVDEIRQMGPKAKDQLDALLAMSDGKLKEYAGLYAEKQKLASDTATEELSGFLRETQEKIAQGNQKIKQLNEEYGPKIGLSLMDGMALGIKQGAGGLRQAMMQTVEGAYQSAVQAMNRLAGGMGYQRSVGGIKAGIVGQDILAPGAMSYGNVDFGQSAAGLSSAALVNSMAGTSAGLADASLTVNLNMDGRKLASALLDPLAKFAKANGTGIINAT